MSVKIPVWAVPSAPLAGILLGIAVGWQFKVDRSNQPLVVYESSYDFQVRYNSELDTPVTVDLGDSIVKRDIFTYRNEEEAKHMVHRIRSEALADVIRLTGK